MKKQKKQEKKQFFLFFLTVLLNVQCAASFGYLISSIFESEETAVAIAPIIMLPIILFGGQFANSGDIQAWISWFQYVSPIRYGFEASLRNEFANYHGLPIYIPDPIKFLNFNLGFDNCMILLALTAVGIKVIAFICLKILIKKF